MAAVAASTPACPANAQNAPRHSPAVANSPPTSGPHSAETPQIAETTCHQPGPEPLGEHRLRRDIGDRDHRPAAHALQHPPAQHDGDVGREGARDTAGRVAERRRDDHVAHPEAPRRQRRAGARDDAAELIERDRPVDERDPADLLHRTRHGGGGEEAVGRVKPDAEAENGELPEPSGLRELAPGGHGF